MRQNPKPRTTRSWLGLLAARAGNVALGAALLGLAGHSLSAAELEVFLLHLASLSFAGMLTTTGIVPLTVRDLVRSSDAVGQLRAVAARATARGGLAAAVFLGAVFAFGDGGDPWLLACGPLLPLLLLQLAAAPRLVAGRTGPLARSELLGRGVAVGLAVALAATGVSRAGPWLLAALTSQIAGGVLLLAGLPPAQRQALIGGFLSARPARPSANEVLLGLGDLLRAAWLHGSQWVVAAFAAGSFAALGAPVRLLLLLSLVPASLATTVLGPWSSLDADQARARLALWVPRLFGLGIAAALALAVLPELWLGLFFSELEDPTAVTALRVLAASVPAMFASGILLPALLARGGEAQLLQLSASGLVTCGLVLLVTLPFADVLAGALALTCTEWWVLWRGLRAVRSPAGAQARWTGAE